MATLSVDSTRAQVALLALFLSKAEARDKICRAIQYGSKFVSGGQPGAAQDVDKSTSLARKVFRLLKVCDPRKRPVYYQRIHVGDAKKTVLIWQSVNELQNLLTPPPKGTPLSLVLLGRVTFFILTYGLLAWL